MEEKSRSSIRKSAPQLDISPTTYWRIVKKTLRMRFYLDTAVQPLTDVHKEQRITFCQWLLDQPNPENFVHKVIWTDEKYCCLKQKPHRKNDGFWALNNPHEVVETNDKNGLKVMIFVAIVDGKVPIVHAFIDENGRRESVNGDCYLKLLQENVWPTFRPHATRQGLWWMQDGAPAHCTTAAKKFLVDKFRSRVISRGTDIAWPAHSPDLNPLDFHFWALAQRQVYATKPSTVDELIDIVKQYAAECREDVLKNVALNVLKRARVCLEQRGGHFQHLL